MAGTLLGALCLSARAALAGATSLSCTQALGPSAVASPPLKIVGQQSAAVVLAVREGHTYVIEVTEKANDAWVEVRDPQNRVLGQADHPQRRTGTRRVIVQAPGASLLVQVTGKELSGVTGSAAVRAFDLGSRPAHSACEAGFRLLAQADADYAAAERTAFPGSAIPPSEARAAFLQAAEGYGAAERALAALEDHALSGEAALAAAAVQYLHLQDWSEAAEWAQTAAVQFGDADPYRRARAQAIRAAAWMETGSPELLERALGVLRELSRFHLRRGERYDVGLQTTNIALTYLFEGRYPACIAASIRAARMFDSVHESLRRAQAWQNQGLCLWGEGRVQAALRWFASARRDIEPEALSGFEHASHALAPEGLPDLYLGLMNNTALVNYELGNFDEALRLFNQALVSARQVHSQLEEAQSLYGLGVTYYAMGGRDLAEANLRGALAIRTVAVDRRGRMQTLRAIANVDAGPDDKVPQGEQHQRAQQALTLDREAVDLAVAPSAIARIRIQTAVHLAQGGRLADAEALLNTVLADRRTDPLISAEALLQRAEVRRQLGRAHEAQADLAAARPRLHRRGRVTEAFEADLELSLELRLAGQTPEALKALDEALLHAEAVRLQTENPELRLQLGTPLRYAYELKIELLRERYERAVAAGSAHEAIALSQAAFMAADASRAHSLADFAALEYPPAVRQALAGTFKRREEIYRELAARRFVFETRLDRSGSEDPHTRQILSDIADLERQADAVNTVIAEAAHVPRLSSRPRATVPALPADTALLAYWIGSESAYVWVVLPGTIRWVRLASPETVAAAATRFHESLAHLESEATEQRLQDSRALYDLIIGPVETSLVNVRQWVVVPDGALGYVPFAALKSSGARPTFVVLMHDIAIAPAAWMITPTSAAPASRERGKLLLIADPVYQPTDPRLKALGHPVQPSGAAALANAPYRDLQRLPFTANEAQGILAEFSPKQVQELNGLQATREQALLLDWAQFRFIHIAAHAVVDTSVPPLSALVMGTYDAQGREVEAAVRASDVSLLTLKADVAVLSGCDTALGRQMASEGTWGLESTLLARGARAVVASLWAVPDKASAELMTLFYQHLLRESMTAPASLAAAMRTIATKAQTADPALWAGFQVSVTALASVSSPANLRP